MRGVRDAQGRAALACAGSSEAVGRTSACGTMSDEADLFGVEGGDEVAAGGEQVAAQEGAAGDLDDGDDLGDFSIDLPLDFAEDEGEGGEGAAPHGEGGGDQADEDELGVMGGAAAGGAAHAGGGGVEPTEGAGAGLPPQGCAVALERRRLRAAPSVVCFAGRRLPRAACPHRASIES